MNNIFPAFRPLLFILLKGYYFKQFRHIEDECQKDSLQVSNMLGMPLFINTNLINSSKAIVSIIEKYE